MCRSVSQESLGGTGGNREAGGGEAVVGPLVGDERWGVPCIKVGSEGKDGRGVVVGGGVPCCLKLPGTHSSPRGPSSRSGHI